MFMNLVGRGGTTSLWDRYRVRELETRIDLLENIIGSYIVETNYKYQQLPETAFRAILPDGTCIHGSSRNEVQLQLFHTIQEKFNG